MNDSRSRVVHCPICQDSDWWRCEHLEGCGGRGYVTPAEYDELVAEMRLVPRRRYPTGHKLGGTGAAKDYHSGHSKYLKYKRLQKRRAERRRAKRNPEAPAAYNRYMGYDD